MQTGWSWGKPGKFPPGKGLAAQGCFAGSSKYAPQPMISCHPCQAKSSLTKSFQQSSEHSTHLAATTQMQKQNNSVNLSWSVALIRLGNLTCSHPACCPYTCPQVSTQAHMNTLDVPSVCFLLLLSPIEQSCHLRVATMPHGYNLCGLLLHIQILSSMFFPQRILHMDVTSVGCSYTCKLFTLVLTRICQARGCFCPRVFSTPFSTKEPAWMIQELRTRRSLVKMGFGPRARNRKRIAPEIGPETGPAWKVGEKWGKIRIFPGFELFFPYFLGGANFGTNLGSYFFLFRARGPK